MKLRKLPKKKQRSFALLNTSTVTIEKVAFNIFNTNTISFSNGVEIQGFCVNCKETPCMNYSKDELFVGVLRQMPSDKSTEVCPVSAIIFNENGFPKVKTESCINCGICLSRCTYGAINFNDGKKVSISKGDNDLFTWFDSITDKQQLEREQSYTSAKQEVTVKKQTQKFYKTIFANFTAVNRRNNYFENILIRNLLLNIGVLAKVRAIGNNDIRFDLIGKIGNKILVGEIGISSTDILEEPRALLDDIAVLHSRYSVSLDNLIPIIFCRTLPNKRSDFYEIIYDIKNVTGIKVKVIPLQILIMLNLCRWQISEDDIVNNFYIDNKNYSLLESMQNVITNISELDPLCHTDYYQATK